MPPTFVRFVVSASHCLGLHSHADLHQTVFIGFCVLLTLQIQMWVGHGKERQPLELESYAKQNFEFIYLFIFRLPMSCSGYVKHEFHCYTLPL